MSAGHYSVVIWVSVILLAVTGVAAAQPVSLPRIQIGVEPAEDPEDVALSLQLLLLLTVLVLAPAILIMMTGFTRIIVVLAFIRNALATNQMPPNQVLIGLALFLTFFVMAPTWEAVNDTAVQPYLKGEISYDTAIERAQKPVRAFMMKNTRKNDLELFVAMTGQGRMRSRDDLPLHLLVPAFVISELKTAFQLGFIIFIPFIVIDMIVASTLMSMGMLMLPPVMISLPFKILLFVMVDGWHLVVQSLLRSFQ